MNYTQPITIKKSKLNDHKLSAEAKSIKEYCATHDVSVTFDENNSPIIKYTKK